MQTAEVPGWTILESVSTAAGALLTFVAVMVSLYLLRQGQQDRRVLQANAERRQAAKVTIHTSTLTEAAEGDSNSAHVIGSEVTVFNESDQLVFVTAIRLVRSYSWEFLEKEGKQFQETESVPLNNYASSVLLRPGASLTHTLPDGWLLETGVGGDFAVVGFRDSESRLWEKRSDTLKLRSMTLGMSAWSQRIQRACSRWPTLHKVLLSPAIWLATRSARKRPNRVPLSLRYVRAMWGYWGAGEQDEWSIPQGAPPLYRYSELYPPPPQKSRSDKQRKAQGRRHN